MFATAGASSDAARRMCTGGSAAESPVPSGIASHPHRMGTRHLQPTIELAQRQLTLLAMALFAIADFAAERRQQVEGDVGRLKVPGVGVSDVVDEGSECGSPRSRFER